MKPLLPSSSPLPVPIPISLCVHPIHLYSFCQLPSVYLTSFLASSQLSFNPCFSSSYLLYLVPFYFSLPISLSYYSSFHLLQGFLHCHITTASSLPFCHYPRREEDKDEGGDVHKMLVVRCWREVTVQKAQLKNVLQLTSRGLQCRQARV